MRNLTAAEICGQVMLAMDELGDWPAGKPERRLTNIVLMGMGEPLFNYDNVVTAMRIIMSGEGVGLSKRRITLSTSGVVPEIIRCGGDLGVNLAISDLLGVFRAGHIHERAHKIYKMTRLSRYTPWACLQPLRPMRNQRHPEAAFVHAKFIAAIRSAAMVTFLFQQLHLIWSRLENISCIRRRTMIRGKEYQCVLIETALF